MSVMDKLVEVSDMTAVEVCLVIARSNPNITRMGFAAYTPQPSMSREIAMNAARGKATSLKRRLRQNSILPEDIIWLERKHVTLERIVAMIDALPADGALALVSRVGEEIRTERHIPMMDFDFPVAKESIREIVNFIKGFTELHGYILATGGGFHFYGIDLVTRDGLDVFLGKCLRMAPCTLGRYVGHQLEDRHMVLRISPKPNGSFPVVVAQV